MSKTKPAPEAELDAETDGPEDDKPMTFWEHLEELRKRVVRSMLALVVGCSIAWSYKDRILEVIVKPFSDSWRAEGIPGEPSLHFAAPGDAFLAYFNLSLIGGLALTAPFLFYQLWAFVAPGLYAREKRYVIPFVVCSSGLFVGGGYFGYLAAFPVTFGYLLSLSGEVGTTITVTPTVMMGDYIGFVTKLLIGFGIVFEIPILFSFLALAGIVNHKQMIRWSRYYIFGAFVVAAILTPPDWASQVIMAIPACLLYGVSIGLVWLLERKEDLAFEDGAATESDDAKDAEPPKRALERVPKADATAKTRRD
jgi:sec-independent protein translocase protein TatC